MGQSRDDDRLRMSSNDDSLSAEKEYVDRRRSSTRQSPSHRAEAARCAGEAADALRAGNVARAQALAAIGQIYATLAAAER
jgi:hypothetical protein